MKRILLSLALLAATACAAFGQFRYGPVAGPTYSSLDFKQNIVTSKDVYGGTAGIQGELMFPGIGFGVDIGLLYNNLGAKVDLGQKKIWASEGYGNERVMFHYLQIPIHLRFKYTRLNGVEEKIAPLVFGGPDFMILMAHDNCKAFKYPGGYLGLTCGGGFEIMRDWQLTVSYTWGMTYAIKTRLLDDNSAKNNHWTVRVTRFF